jgi:co-chaperonin GroES (HSP10)
MYGRPKLTPGMLWVLAMLVFLITGPSGVNVQSAPTAVPAIAAGPGKRDEQGKLIPVDVKSGDRVLLGKWSGSEVKLDGKDLIIMPETDILDVLDQSTTV